MSEGYSIELADELIGLVIREKGERFFTFFTAVKPFNALDGQRFRGPLDAERAARAHLARRKQRNPAPGSVRSSKAPGKESCALAGSLSA